MSARASFLLFVACGAVLGKPVRADQAAPADQPTHPHRTPAQRARAYASLPDWTGLWETETAAALTAGRLVPPPLWGKPPYNEQWQKTFRDVSERGDPGDALAPAQKVCNPQGFPANMDSPVPDYVFELLVTPEQTVLLSTDGAVRHIYTDGRPHPKAEDLWPTAAGDSIGHWEGATLVIDTIARKAGPVGPAPGLADLSDQAHFTERLRRLDRDTLQDDMTIEDPQRFAHPWQISIRYRRVTNMDRMIATNCAENDRNPVVDGHFIIAPAGAPEHR